jgi:hypothetical protein
MSRRGLPMQKRGYEWVMLDVVVVVVGSVKRERERERERER